MDAGISLGVQHHAADVGAQALVDDAGVEVRGDRPVGGVEAFVSVRGSDGSGRTTALVRGCRDGVPVGGEGRRADERRRRDGHGHGQCQGAAGAHTEFSYRVAVRGRVGRAHKQSCAAFRCYEGYHSSPGEMPVSEPDSAMSLPADGTALLGSSRWVLDLAGQHSRRRGLCGAIGGFTDRVRIPSWPGGSAGR
ncbi:hypothetical protein SBD_1544 [Streptomyces bottropensis ATCC 25435]|uniref:Uncharacterized protein n=1 Tax=Streptomyces bottropensis ATCC 25435 TaxID=1054862 RepID=M3F5W8_9ACTN|nr:hypothetical protein SBD_1544 [Streptomyces bottropensis ATCC 25435]